MKCFILVILLYFLVTINAHVDIVLSPNNNNNLEGVTYCHSELTGVMEKGEVISIEGECRKATCEENGKIVIRKCKNIPMSPCGIQAADYTQPFPLCCPQAQPCS